MDNLPINHRILVVDDNEAIHDDFRKILHPTQEEADPFEQAAFGAKSSPRCRADFEIDSAYQGEQALEIVRQAIQRDRPYAVAFMDVRMPPGWDGIETTARLWAEDPEIQVVICTAYADYSWEEMIAKLGCSDRLVILKKPFDTIEVVQLADCLTKKWQLLQEAKSRMAELGQLVAERSAQIIQEQAKFKAIFDNSPMGIFQTSREGKILCANPASAHIVGYQTVGELLDNLTEIGAQLYVDPTRRDEFVRLVGRDHIVRDFEFQVKCRDGSKKWLNLTAYAVTNSEGALQYYEGFFFDQTDRRAAEEAQRAMEIQLRHAQKMESIGRLSAGIAHEINTPTQYVSDNIRFLKDSFASCQQTISALANTLEQASRTPLTAADIAQAKATLKAMDLDYLNREIPAAIDQSLEGAGRISKIVSAMRDFSHPSGQSRGPADLNHAIETTIIVARNEWKYVAEMRLDLDQQLPLVNCYRDQFNQAILNLVINAAQAIGEVVAPKGTGKGTITISTRRIQDWVEIRIGDTGPGIPEAIRGQIFDPFFTTKPVGKGTGQGLTVVYNSIVKLHQGTIDFETEMGKGTTFIVRLPLNAKQTEVSRSFKGLAGAILPSQIPRNEEALF